MLAGDDLLEGPWNPATFDVLNGLRDAVNSGRISQDRIDQSVRRILTLKAQYGILPLRQGASNGANTQTLQAKTSRWARATAPARCLPLEQLRLSAQATPLLKL